MVIDFHTHTFPDKIAASTIQKLAGTGHVLPYTDGSVNGLLASMKKAGIDFSVNLPVSTRPGQARHLNQSLENRAEELRQAGVLTFGAMHPADEDFRENMRELKNAGIPGIKLHPAYQEIDFDDIRTMRIIDYANELGLIVLTHAGLDISFLDHNYVSVPMILNVLDQVHPDKLVLAHMGGWDDWHTVESDLAGADVWLDTAFSLGPILPNPAEDILPCSTYNLHSEDFLRLARKHGMDRILFATDSPWSGQADYLKLVRSMPLSETELDQFLHRNAETLLGDYLK